MTSIIPVAQTHVGGELIKTCNARDLHAFLEVGRDFSTWFKKQVERYSFEENKDFVKIVGEKISSDITIPQTGERDSTEVFGKLRIDYFITLDMAKELAMVERNEKGKQARRYFIECERVAKEASVAERKLMTPLSTIEQLGDYMKRTFNVPDDRVAAAVLTTAEKYLGCPTGEFHRLIPTKTKSEVYELTPTTIGERLTPVMSAIAVNRLLAKLGLIENISDDAKRKEWRLTDTGARYGQMRAYQRNGHSGYQIQWHESVLDVVRKATEGDVL